MAISPVQMFLEQAARQPERVAVQAIRSWSYGELARLTKAIAHYLRESGLKDGDRVAMVSANSAEYIAIYFGAQLAGGVIVPLNALDKSRTLKGQVQHSGAKVLFANSERPDLLAHERESGAAICIEIPRDAGRSGSPELEQWFSIANDDSEREFRLTAKADSLATILYTSGTTGSPKAVMLSHANLLANMRSIHEFLPIEADDRCLVVLPFYHSFGNSILTTHLSSGASMTLQNSIAFPKQVFERVRNERITSIYGVPLTFSLLFGKGLPVGADLSSVRYMAQAGGAMHRKQIDQLQHAAPGIDLFVMYGQTEATARLAYVPADMLETKAGSAGKPVPNVEIEIRKQDGSLASVGEFGEIWVRGANVMMGYWNDPGETATVLKDNWLWTRDRGRLDDDGYLYIEGRSSDMIKTGANRVSPVEIEEVIAALDGVSEVGVLGVGDDLLGQIIVAIVVRRAGSNISEKAIKAHCLNLLAPYKIPKRVIAVDKLPRTSTGKIKRQLLAQFVSGVKDGER
jgi:acyl-CoA synthetase (AMP-forming)/AMP-acid ligase II